MVHEMTDEEKQRCKSLLAHFKAMQQTYFDKRLPSGREPTARDYNESFLYIFAGAIAALTESGG